MNTLVIMGTAPCLDEDIKNLAEITKGGDCDLMAAGMDAFKRPVPWKYVASGHYEDLPFIKAYAGLHKIKGYKLIHYQLQVGVDIIIPLDMWERGSSALLGVMAARKEGYLKIVLCGCPMEGPNPGHKGADYSMFQGRWTESVSVLHPYVRSMSGFTKKLLSAPDEEWLNV
jgi:hypothetical protein